jgi:hypothetical protein
MENSTAPVGKSEFPLQERVASHWAWKKIVRPEVPEVENTEWPGGETDQFLLSKLEHADLSPAPEADRRTILRRLSFDIVGLPPTIEQQDRFLNDPAETSVAMEKIVDELLASPHFGERWARHWLDLMRYAETLGHEFDYPLPYAWRYRDYVIRALNADVPYDQFVREHILVDIRSWDSTSQSLPLDFGISAKTNTHLWTSRQKKLRELTIRLTSLENRSLA